MLVAAFRVVCFLPFATKCIILKHPEILAHWIYTSGEHLYGYCFFLTTTPRKYSESTCTLKTFFGLDEHALSHIFALCQSEEDKPLQVYQIVLQLSVATTFL